MSRRFPIVPTIVVGAAIVLMIALGCWQLLVRLPEKEAYLAQLGRNPGKPAVAFPRTPDDRLLFRRTEATCAPPVTLAKAGAGKAGYRIIATCAGGTKVQLGTTRDPKAEVAWGGGAVSGWISHAPDATPLIESLFRTRAPEMLLVADTPLPGLGANSRPDVGIVPNNHLAYAGQWFFFAIVAAVIYTLAVRARMRRPVAAPHPAR